MSGITGVVDMRGKPIRRDQLQSMTLAMAPCGPDAQKIWSDGPVGLGHAMLHTSDDSPAAPQPCSLDGRIWITADARVDGRQELAAALADPVNAIGRNPADVALILSAYHKWGEECVHHLRGDFSFAIWDGLRQILFCARDHFGVKPFYFCRTSDEILFASSLDALRLHPKVSASLNEQTVADLLLHGFSIHPDISIFADIQKLPPAHTLTIEADGRMRLRKYWRLPVEPIRRFKRPAECIEEFDAVLHEAVSDRLRTARAGILMSGGVDSTSIAAVAKNCMARQFDRFDLQAFTLFYDWLIPSKEAAFARQAAAAIGIPVHHLQVDAHDPYEFSAATGAMRAALERSFGGAADSADQLLSMGACRVGLSGYGGDELFHPGFTDLKAWLKRMRWPSLARETFAYWRAHGRLPAIGLRTYVRKKLARNRATASPCYPPWFNRDFERRLNLRQQWRDYHRPQPPADSVRSAAVQGLRHPLWQNLFESFDPAMTGIPVELRYPFMDLRLVRFCLQLPPIPWCVDKLLLRRVAGQRLPAAVRLRPKTPLPGFPDYEHLVHSAEAEKSIAQIPDAFETYIDLSTYRKIARQPQHLRPSEHSLITHPLKLACWLQHMNSRPTAEKERSPWQIPRKSRSTKSRITHPDCANMGTSTA